MKNTSRGIVFCMVLAALVVSMMLVPVGFAAIGVEKGDWAKYDVESEVEAPEEIKEEIEEMEWANFEVKSISNTTVTLEGTFVYGRVRARMETMDGINTGFIIEANLIEGDQVMVPIFFEAGVPMYINGTVSRKYAGANREVNYVDASARMEKYNANMDLEAYWDKTTGFLCEMSMSMSGEIEGETLEMSMSFKMTETNMWEAEAEEEAASFIGQWWFWVIIVVIIIVVAGSAVMLLRGRKAAPTPSE